MKLPERPGAKSVEQLMQEYIELQQHIKFKSMELDELKEKINDITPEDKLVIENVGIFQRKSGSVRRRLDKNLVKNFLEPEVFEQCHTESQVKPSVSIISWENNELRKKSIEGNK